MYGAMVRETNPSMHPCMQALHEPFHDRYESQSRRKASGKRFNAKMLEELLVAPWKPRLEPPLEGINSARLL